MMVEIIRSGMTGKKNMKVKILRQHSAEAEPYWETFDYNGPDENSVAGVIDYLNYNDDIRNDKGEKTGRIIWDCACLQGLCGACAMVINKTPALACETFLKDIKGKELVLEPLGKFPVIRDLSVDRSSIQDNLKKTNVYIGKYDQSDPAGHEHQYLAAKCLKCGLCLEVCPNYVSGKNFFGAVFANDCYLVASRSGNEVRNIKRAYGDHFGAGCSKSMSCMDVCPVGIPTIASMAKMNR